MKNTNYKKIEKIGPPGGGPTKVKKCDFSDFSKKTPCFPVVNLEFFEKVSI